jgi:hypothetical protein
MHHDIPIIILIITPPVPRPVTPVVICYIPFFPFLQLCTLEFPHKIPDFKTVKESNIRQAYTTFGTVQTSRHHAAEAEPTSGSEDLRKRL